jgi:hypothetical protein
MLLLSLRIITAPSKCFHHMPKTGGLLEPIVFNLLAGFSASIIHAIWRLLGFGYGGQAQSGLAWIILSIIFMPVILVICSFIGSAIILFIWRLLGSKQNYETSYRCIAYLMALAPIIAMVEIIPYAGVVLSFAIATFYIVAVSTAVHRISARKAWLVFGAIGGILAALLFYPEYSNRNPTPEQVRKAAEETARQYQRHIDETKKQTEFIK